MKRNDLRNIDLNLLVVFEALIQARNVSRAAEKLSVRQPAVSAALSRLRTLFNDPLFERVGRKMEPTARALRVAQTLGPALDSVCNAINEVGRFDPLTSTAVFRVGLNDDIEFALLPGLVKRLREEAPDVVLIVRRASSAQMSQLLLAGEISVGVGYLGEIASVLQRQVIRQCSTVLLRADTQPGAVSLDEFCLRPHASVSYAGNVVGRIDAALEQLHRQRHVALTVTQLYGLGELLRDTDLLAAVPDYAARVVTALGGVRAEPLPLELERFDLSMAWRGEQKSDPAEVWLRSLLQRCFAEA
jgi:LysR family transcriptional activator of mexEF-oprN operon